MFLERLTEHRSRAKSQLALAEAEFKAFGLDFNAACRSVCVVKGWAQCQAPCPNFCSAMTLDGWLSSA